MRVVPKIWNNLPICNEDLTEITNDIKNYSSKKRRRSRKKGALSLLSINPLYLFVRFHISPISQRFRLMQLGGGLGKIAANIALESLRNRCYFRLAKKVALESATKIACVNGPLRSLHFLCLFWSLTPRGKQSRRLKFRPRSS